MKKFGKVLLFGAAVGTAAAAAYHYFQKMDKETTVTEKVENEEEESYFDEEDFDDELDITTLQEAGLDEDEDFDASVEKAPAEDIADPTPDTDIDDMATTSPSPSFSPLADTLMQEEDVEEFFDEDLEDITEE